MRQYIGQSIKPSEDVVLVVEAALSTLGADKTKKARVYGKQGIPEYWIVAIERRELIVHRQPDTDTGGYADMQTYTESQTVSPLARPDTVILVADLIA
ncbi:MAG: Uma2 family endonuclease [Akkermansiaceae bacterium]|nr:Uma2 family endonuclease [Armatimonadota bacterium]